LVIEGEAGESGARGGRRAIPLEFNYKASLIVAVDLRGTAMVGALADLEGNILRRNTIPSNPGDSDDNLERLTALIGDLIETPCSREQKTRHRHRGPGHHPEPERDCHLGPGFGLAKPPPEEAG
jgi:hypothetical protein